jgi:hypothetical protein
MDVANNEKTQPSQQDLHGPSVLGHPAIALFTHSICTRMNAVKFAHQLLGNPRILTLLKAISHGFLHGCPNMTKKLILKYLNPSPATAKGHIKHPCQGIQSTTPKLAPAPRPPPALLSGISLTTRSDIPG